MRRGPSTTRPMVIFVAVFLVELVLFAALLIFVESTLLQLLGLLVIGLLGGVAIRRVVAAG